MLRGVWCTKGSHATMDTPLKLIFTLLCFMPLESALPVWDPNTPAVIFASEDDPLGTLLANLTISGTNIRLDVNTEETRQLCNITEKLSSGNDVLTAYVTLAEELDRDFNPDKRYLDFTAKDDIGDRQRIITLQITDVNDNPPQFLNQPYISRPPENTAVGTVIYSAISVSDPDATTRSITVEIVPDEVISGLFGLNNDQTNNKAEITLLKELDYETRSSYVFKIVATDDGGLNRTTTMEVDVQDVQDTPPFFLFDVYRGAVTENLPANTSVIQVQAEDGDRDIKNDITYSIIEGPTDLFNIDSITGIIYATKTMDREDPIVVAVNGVFTLVVQAEELNNTWPQYGNTTATVNVYATIEDVNDNSPTFNTTKPYTAFVRSDVPDNSLIYFGGDGYMHVFDRDQTGKSATFGLSLEPGSEYFNVFAPSPTEVFSEANVLIRVIDASAIRSLGGTIITFDVKAQEIGTAESYTGRSTVVLSVEATEEPTTTPLPVQEDLFQAPDIVVFVVCFLVFLNIITSIVICYILRRRGRKEKEGLSRHGSKYYIKKRTTNDFTNHGLHDPNTTQMIEVDPEVAVCPRVGNGEYAE